MGGLGPATARGDDSLASTGRARERAVLVAVEFAGERRKLSGAARLARSAALLLGGDAGVHAQLNGEVSDADAKPGGAGAETRTRAGVPTDLDSEAAVAEFVELAESAGADVAAVVQQRRARPDAATLIGTGKLREIEGIAASENADVVLFNHDLSPSQLRNLEARLPCRVIDRTQLILDIFARHARTREGQLQVELAQLEYQLPRLAGRGRAMSQLGGGIGTRGPGETQLETDRRKIRTRIDHVQAELEGVRRIRGQQRQRREGVPVPVVALVGYTNAGKSTLFNALTGAGVLQSARMFATLDTTLRQLRLPSRRKVLVSDTVGFIRDLPHTLVTSFRATLEEVERAELLLHVQDAASPEREEHREQVRRVLAEIGVTDRPVIEVWNKVDLLGGGESSVAGGGAAGVVRVSALRGWGLPELLEAVDAALVADPLLEVPFRMPQSEGRALAALEAGATLEERRFAGNLVYFTAVGPASLLNRYRRFHEVR